uniref:Apoptogenic protein 1, mitochondrial n=1 Tax=Rhabditophanes sp. KR3021 TaxID=114890 RepID=A0AC35THX4_9BILA
MEASDGSKVRLDKRFNWVGPPNRLSKIRPIKLKVPENETELERSYTKSREQLNEWNSKFWETHNLHFEERRNDFIKKRRKEIGKLNDVTSSDMSIFYKKFLNQEYLNLKQYNQTWYIKNLQLIWPALKVNVIRFGRFFRK